MDKDTLISFIILDTLNRARKQKGEYTRVNLKHIADELLIDFHSFRLRYENELQNLGYIVPDVAGNAYITKQGVAMIEKNNPLYQEYRQAENKSITITAPVTSSTIIQGDNNNVIITLDFLAKLESEINHSSLPPEDKKTWLSRIKEISSNPMLISIVTKVLELFDKN